MSLEYDQIKILNNKILQLMLGLMYLDKEGQIIILKVPGSRERPKVKGGTEVGMAKMY